MTAAEMNNWRKFWNVEPWGAYRDNLHFSIITSLFYNSKVKRHRQKNPDHFMLKHPTVAKELVSRKTLAAFQLMAKPKTQKAIN